MLRPLVRAIENHELDLYFVTSRVGRTAKAQTEMWLRERGIYHPTVIVSSEKGLVARAVGATHTLDDSPKQIRQMYEESPETSVYIMARKYNRCVEGAKVNSVAEFVQRLEVDR